VYHVEGWGVATEPWRKDVRRERGGMEVADRERDVDRTPPAPGDLELVRAFLSVHDHVRGDERSLPPSRESLREFLVERGMLPHAETPDPRDLDLVLAVHQALHRWVELGPGGSRRREDAEVVNAAVHATGLEPRFEGGGTPRLEPRATGVLGALGRILAIAFLAEIDGSWHRLKVCDDETCVSVFYDRSKNRSGRWCSMQECGNRNKVRAWRARQRVARERRA
jgi:predicted RNA-binding Zn ribbon-like protein